MKDIVLDSFQIVARLFIGTVFIWAGSVKLFAPWQEFHAAILEYEILPYGAAQAAAFILPWVEVIFGVFIIVGYMTQISACVLLGMTMSFLGMLLTFYFRTGSFPASCGCFGSGFSLTPAQLLILDVVDFFLAIFLWKRSRSKWSLDALLGGRV